MKQFLLKTWLMLVCLLVGAGTSWGAEGDTHDFTQTLSQLLNNSASISSIEIPAQSYPIKEVKVTWNYNKATAEVVTIAVKVGSTDFGSAKVGTNTTETNSFTGTSTTGNVTISFTNHAGSGTGKGTFKVTNVQLVEGASTGGGATPEPEPGDEDPSISFIFNTDAGLSALGIAKPNASAGTNLGTSNYTSGEITMTATSGSTATRVYNSQGATDLRIYNNGTLTFTGAVITKIELAGNTVNGFTANVGEYSTNTWTGSATSITLTATATERINTIRVTYASNGKTTPTLYFAEDTYNATIGEDFTAPALTNPKNVTVSYTSSATGVATVNASTGEISLVTAGTTTITASFEGDEEYNEASASYELVVAAAPLTTVDAIYAAATAAGSTATDCRVTFNNWVVSGVKGSNAYVTDNAGKGFIVYANSHGFVVGDILSGTAACKVQLYRAAAELTALTSSTEGLTVTKGGVVTPVTTIALASLSGVNTGAVLSYENLEYNGTNFTDGETSLKPYNILITLPTLVSGKNYNVTGVYVQYDATKEIAPRTAEDFELVEVLNKYTVTFAETLNGTITVKDGETVIGNGDEVTEGTTLTIECTPTDAENYRFQNWQYKAEDMDAFATRTKDFSYTMPSANVQFKANFELIPTYTISWSVNGTIVKTENLKEGAKVNAPGVSDISDKKFINWTTVENYSNATIAPAFIDVESTTATESKTYYAVFATQNAGGEKTTLLSEDFSAITTGNSTATSGSGTSWSGNVNFTSTTTAYQAGGAVRLGGGSSIGSIISKTLDLSANSGAFTVEFDAKGWTTVEGQIKVTPTGCTPQTSSITAVMNGDFEHVKMNFTGGQVSSTITFATTTKRAFIDNIVVTTGGGATYTDYTTTVATPVTSGTLEFVATNDDGYWATFTSTENVIFDASDVVVYTVAVDNNTLVVIEADNTSLSCVTDKTKDEGWVAGYYVQAGAAVLINSIDESVNYYFIDTDPCISNSLTEVETDSELNMLRPASAAKETDGSYLFYKLAYGDWEKKTNLGFWWGAENGGVFESREGGVYLAVPATSLSNMRGFSFNEGSDPTGIETVKTTNDNVIYNLQGQRVSRLQKGVNIVNGSKVLR